MANEITAKVHDLASAENGAEPSWREFCQMGKFNRSEASGRGGDSLPKLQSKKATEFPGSLPGSQ